MAPNTSSVFNKAPPQAQQTESKAGDAGVLVVAPPQPIESSVPGSDVLSATSSSAAVPLTAITATTAATGVPTSQASAAALANALRADEGTNSASCLRRRRRHVDRFPDLDDAATTSVTDDEDATALAASERHFQQQLQMSRFARVSPAALDGLKPFRKSCLKRSSSELPTDLLVLKHEAAAAAATANRALVTAPALPAAPLRPVQKNRRRCYECKAKVGLTAVTCRCDYTFCNKHRYAEEHKCSFDFKVSAKRQLESENPRVVPSKVARIN